MGQHPGCNQPGSCLGQEASGYNFQHLQRGFLLLATSDRVPAEANFGNFGKLLRLVVGL